jgi:curved DNA-binding protein CbpA
MKDYYQILGILETASQEDIRRAYLRLALIWHPDRHAGESPERIAIATASFKEIGEAYGILSDPAKKADYDWRLRRGRVPPPPRPARSSASAAAPARSSSSASGNGMGRSDSSYSRARNWGIAYGHQTGRASEATRGRESIAEMFGYFFCALLVVVFLNWGLFREAAYQIRNSGAVKTTPWSNPASATANGAKNINDILNDLMGFPELRTMDVNLPEPPADSATTTTLN